MSRGAILISNLCTAFRVQIGRCTSFSFFPGPACPASYLEAWCVYTGPTGNDAAAWPAIASAIKSAMLRRDGAEDVTYIAGDATDAI